MPGACVKMENFEIDAQSITLDHLKINKYCTILKRKF
jgi:hypothetical protein